MGKGRASQLTLAMAVYSLNWDETKCLNSYGMLSLHEVFEIVSSQLTETDIEVLSFLLTETCSTPHPLDPAGWTVNPPEGGHVDSGVSPSPKLLDAWKRLRPKSTHHSLVPSYKHKSGLELLLDLEKRGYLSDGNLEPLLQLLRVLTRHDLLPLVSHKKRRTGEDRIKDNYGPLRCWIAIMCFFFFFFYVLQYLQKESGGGMEHRVDICSAPQECSPTTDTLKYPSHPSHSNYELVRRLLCHI